LRRPARVSSLAPRPARRGRRTDAAPADGMSTSNSDRFEQRVESLNPSQSLALLRWLLGLGGVAFETHTVAAMALRSVFRLARPPPSPTLSRTSLPPRPSGTLTNLEGQFLIPGGS
jgi:hypothetical protein